MAYTPEVTVRSGERVWRYNLAARIFVGLLAGGAIALGLALLWLPFRLDAQTDQLVAIYGPAALVVLTFGAFMAFGAVALARTRLTLGATSLRGVVPVENGWSFAPSFRTVDVPVSEIRAVDRRVEIVRTLGLSMARQSLSIVTASGERIGLFTNPDTAVVRLPLGEIAGAIAAAAGIAVTDRGTVISKAPGLFGSASSSWTETPLDAPRAARARRGALITLQVIFGLMALTWILRACSGS